MFSIAYIVKMCEKMISCGAYPKGFPEEIVHSIIKPHELKECGNGFKFEDKRSKK